MTAPTPRPLVKYKYVKYDTGNGYIREGLEPNYPDGTWYRVDDVDPLLASHAALVEALTKAIETIHAWHDMKIGNDERLWTLYRYSSPEMKQIEAALALAKGAP